jgi:hypothetical protein
MRLLQNKRYYALASIVFLLFISILINFNWLLLQVQNYLGINSHIQIASLSIQRPNDWLVNLSRENVGEHIKMYSLIPYFESNNKRPIDNQFYMLIRKNKDIWDKMWFFKMDDDLIDKLMIIQSKIKLEKVIYPDWSIVKINGCEVIRYTGGDLYVVHTILQHGIEIKSTLEHLDGFEGQTWCQ